MKHRSITRYFQTANIEFVNLITQYIEKKRRFDYYGKRAFDAAWEHEYFFCYREHDQKAMCLICRESVADLKRYNVKRHYDSMHKSALTVHMWEKTNA